MSFESAVSRYVRKYGESYPGEANEWVADAFFVAVDQHANDMASHFAHSPLAILEGEPDFDCGTVAALVRHIIALRELVPADQLSKAIAVLQSELADDKAIQEWANKDVLAGEV